MHQHGDEKSDPAPEEGDVLVQSGNEQDISGSVVAAGLRGSFLLANPNPKKID